MKLKSFFIAAIALTGFAGNANADTSLLQTSDGWTKITTLPIASDIADNYYVIVDNSQDLMLTIANGSHNKGKWYSLSLWYQTSVSPTTSAILSKLWILQKGSYGDGSYALQNVEYPARLLQTEYEKGYLMETNDVSSPNDWSKLNFAYSNGYWTIENGQYPASSSAGYKGHLGPWDENNTYSNIQNGQELAGNKSGDYIGRFQIYAISRTRFKENYLAAASSSNPVDVSFIYVNNPTLDLNIDGWTRSASSFGGTASGNYCTETWHSSTDFKFYQDVESLPEGAYQVSVQARSQTNSGAVYVTVNSNTLSTPVNTTTSSSSMQTEATTMLDRTTGKITTPSISLDEGQTLTMGYMDNVANHWDVFDNFKLYYLGNDLTVYAAARDEVKTTAENAIASNLVPNACEAAIQTAINNNSGDYNTKAEYVAAQNAIQTALDTYFTNDLKAAYSKFNAFKTKVETLSAGQSSSTELTTFNTAITNATTAVEAATTVAAIDSQTANLRSASLNYISSVEGQFDITFLASQAISDWKKKDGSAAGEVTWAVSNRGDLSFAENYEGTAATTGTVLYQTVSNLPAGYYQVGMYAMAAYTPGRDIPTEATEGDANRSYAFAGDLNDASSIQRTGIPIPFKSEFDLSELTTLDVNIHLTGTGNTNALTFGVQKDANGSNWHFAQIMSIVYSKSPDLTQLKATRDVLVAEATGLKSGTDADYLTSAQKTALQDAINAGNAADDFDELNTVTLTTLPNAINTAKQQIAQVKAAIPAMLAALERFENDYNLQDGTDYRRVTMSAGAWTDLLTAVNNVTTALDDISQASNYGTLKDALVSQMDATDASLRLFKSYKSMVEGTTALGIVGSYGTDSNMDTDATQETAIAALNTAFGTYAASQSADFSVAGFLGENLDFNAAAGSVINGDNSNTIKNVTGWEVEYADADTWAVLQTDQKDYTGKLYIRKNWGSAATTLTVFKQKMLPVGKYRLSLSWNSDMENMTNLSQFKLGETATTIGAVSDGTEPLEYIFEVTGAATPFDLTIGFQKTGTDNTPAMIIVDDVTLERLVPSITISEEDDSAPATIGYANVTLTRTLKGNQWNGFSVPFGFTVSGSALDGVEVKQFKSVAGNEITLETATTIVAGDPYLVKPASDIVNPIFNAVNVMNPEEAVKGDGDYKFKAHLYNTTLPTDGSVAYVSTSDSSIKKLTSGGIKGLRSIFNIPVPTPGTNVKALVVHFEDSADGILTVDAEGNLIEGAIYNLAGQRISAPQKGVNIINGKKVLVK